jgi:PAS domain S-box-containing protein
MGGGWLWTDYSAKRTDLQWRADFSHHAELVAAALDTELIKQLSGTPADTTLPAYSSLKKRLAQIIKAGDGYRFSYLMAMKDGQVIFLVDNEPPESKDESVAGDVYKEASDALRSVFHHPVSFTEGPLPDEWGIWVSGFAQVPGITMFGLPVYLGLDHNAQDWGSRLARLRQEHMLIVMILGLLIAGLFVSNYLTAEGRIRQAASEERLRLSLHGANLVSWEIDIPSQTISINEGADTKSLAVELPPRLSAHEFLSLVHPDDLDSAKTGLSNLLQGMNGMVESEFRLRQTKGEYLWVLSRGRILQRNSKGVGLRAGGLLLDISDRKGNEINLVRSREEATRLALVAENTTSAVIITTANGHVEWVNAGFTQITGYSLQEILGRKPGELLQGRETDPDAVKRMKIALSSGMGFQETILNYAKNGHPYWVSIECQPLTNREGKLSGYMAIEANVSRQVNAEQALQSQRRRLQQINETLLSLRSNYDENVLKLTILAAHVFDADRVFYDRIEKNLLKIVAKYGVPDDFPDSIPAAGSLFAEVILGKEPHLFVQNPGNRGTNDPDIKGFHTYLGEGVRLSGDPIGSLNVLFRRPFELSSDLLDCLVIIAQALSREELLQENRRKIDTLANLEATERNRFSTLLKSMEEAVLVEDPKTIITFANPAFQRIFGVALPMIRGTPCGALLKKIAPIFIDPDVFLASAEEVRDSRKISLSHVFETVDGRYLACDFVSILSHGVHYGYMWYFRDITRLKRQQLFLETIADTGQLLLNTPLDSPNAWMALVTLLGKKIGLDRVRVARIWVAEGSIDTAYVIADWNRSTGEASYYTKDNGISYSTSEFPNYWQTAFMNGRSVYESGPMGTPFLKEMGTKSFLCIPLSVEGRLWGTIGLHCIRNMYEWHEDEITLMETSASLISSRLELQQTEKELVAAKNAADQASRAKSAFLATMSHEIRTPLNAVIGISSLLLETKLEPQQQDYAATVAASGEILLELINDILDYSKIEAGRIELENIPFSLVDVIVESLEILARPVAEKKIDLSYSIDSALAPVVVGDSTRLKQILLNLLSNAVKFTERGSISVLCESADNGLIRFTIQDTGIGMNEEVLARLFEPFMQADSSVTRKYGGTGLGLAISNRLISLMGGRIEVESKLGEGSKFTFEIPLSPGQSSWKHDPVQDAALVGKKVLIVDDNRVNRQFLRDQLQMWGMKTMEAGGSLEALELLKSDEDIVLGLLDYQMPELDGLALARAIKAIPHRKKFPMILLSSVIEHVPKKDAALFAAALTKPLRVTQLLEVISGALGSAEPRPKSRRASSPDTAGIRVLVAEDNVTNQKVIQMMLARLEVEPVIVANGLEALEAVKKANFDLALIDIQMPVMDGLEASRRMREFFGAGNRPEIIALTANAFKEDREACLDAGMDGYLVKPITLDRLRNVIENVAVRIRKGISI